MTIRRTLCSPLLWVKLGALRHAPCCRTGAQTAALWLTIAMVVLVLPAQTWAADAPITFSNPLLTEPEHEREQTIERRLTATPVQWGGSQISLAEIVGILSATGNQTQLLDGTLGTTMADLPAFAGNYWQGVIAVCQAFDLVIQPGQDLAMDPTVSINFSNSTPMINGYGGAVVLARRANGQPHPIYQACGCFVIEVVDLHLRRNLDEHDNDALDTHVELRSEPHLGLDQIGRLFLGWTSIDAGTGKHLEVTQEVNNGQSNCGFRLESLPNDLEKLHAHATLDVVLFEPLTITTTLRPGQRAKGNLLDQEVMLQLLGENSNADAPLSQPGPGLAAFLPAMVMGWQPHLEVTNAGQSTTFNMQGSSFDGKRIGICFSSAPLPASDHVITLSGMVALSAKPIPMELEVDLHQLSSSPPPSSAAPDLMAASHVTWPACRATLAEAVLLLQGKHRTGETPAPPQGPSSPAAAAAPEQVVLDVGADERAIADLPAFSGTFWEGVLVLCHAYDLILDPPLELPSVKGVMQETDSNGQPLPTPTCISGGPLQLSQRRGRPMQACQACGILLLQENGIVHITDQDLVGTKHSAKVLFNLRLEPGWDTSLISAAELTLASRAITDDGHLIPLHEVADNPYEAQRWLRPVMAGTHPMWRQFAFNQRRSLLTGPHSRTAATCSVEVPDLGAGPANLNLSGLVTLHLSRPATGKATLTPGVLAHVELAGQQVRVMLDVSHEASSGNIPLSLPAKGKGGMVLTVDFDCDVISAVALELQDGAGKTLGVVNENGTIDGKRGRAVAFYSEGIAAGTYSVVISSKVSVSTPSLPLALHLTVP